MKESKLKKDTYVNIQSWMITELNLKGNELLIYAIIYGFSQDGETKFTGSSTYLCNWTNSSKQSVFNCLKSLVEKGFLKRFETKINGITLVDYQSTNFRGVVNKVDRGSQQSCIGGSKESLPHNIDLYNIEQTIDYNIDTLQKKINQEYENLPQEIKDKSEKIWNNATKSFKNWTLEDFENDIKLHRGAVNFTKDQFMGFYEYWKELSPSGKMKFQMQKTWQTDLRLKYWAKNDFNWNKPNQTVQEKTLNKMEDAFEKYVEGVYSGKY